MRKRIFSLDHLDVWIVLGACVVALGLLVLSRAAKAESKLTLNPEISVGGAMSNDQAIGTSFSQTGFLFGVGAGVGVTTNAFVLEPFARYSFMHDSGDVFSSSSLLTTNLIEAGARLGFRLTKATDVYGIVGYAWEDLKLTGASTANPSGLMLGGGIEHSLNNSPWFVRAEYTHDFFDKVTITEAKVTPDLNVVRLGLVYKFGAGSAPDVFDTSKLAPAAERACDPKLANCHPLK